MSASFIIGRAKFAQAQLPQKVQDPPFGHTFERPAHWGLTGCRPVLPGRCSSTVGCFLPA
ncbi:hypothetical protein OG758_11575 [Streptomyces sp. NBC_01474]|uniref:hypothetical protein n=1 Tax=unclassified Streptomyces TaxID=2593676 RepID=UPI002DDC5BFB|nr:MULTISPECIES: hypothetical protein [unclassified Streptomyces]WSD94726.1 hypothetical protein OG758_11575 [Streptomyces sp. NBC_01474]